MPEIYPFNRGFRLKILSLMLDPLWMAKYGSSIILPEYFEVDDEEAIASAICEYHTLYGHVPRDPDDVVIMCDGKYEDTIHTVFDSEWDVDLAEDVVVQFAKEQAAKIAILESIDDVAKGSVKRVIDRMKSVISIGDDLRSPGLDVIDDVDKWLYTLWQDKVRTGWPHIDKILEGGLAAGELGLIMAPVNRGKSMALVNIGFGAAGLGSGKNVVHITHEMSDVVVLKRYGARNTFGFPKRGGDLDMYEEKLYAAAARLMPGKVRVIDLGRSSLDDVRGSLSRLRTEGYEFDLVIDDYPDLMVPVHRYGERRFELSELYESLRSLGKEFGVPVWAATHSNRAAFSKEVITLKDIAEDMGKARIADVIIALCQTQEEEEASQCRLFMAKVRDGVKHAMLDAKYFGKSQAIITTGVAKKRDRDA